MKYTIQTRIGELINDARAKQILERHIPGASSHPQLHMALGMTLMEVSTYPEAGLNQAKLQALLADLNREDSA